MMLGKTGAGKTQIAMGLIQKKVTQPLLPTKGIQTLRHESEGITLVVTDPTGKDDFPNTRRSLYKDQAFILYCADLSTILDEDDQQKVKKELDLYRSQNPNGKVVLVGTHADQCKNPLETLKNLENDLRDLGVTIDHKTLEIEELQRILIPSLAKKEDLTEQSDVSEKAVKSSLKTDDPSVKEADNAIKRETSEDSIFIEAKKKLLTALKDLPEEKKQIIEKKLKHLEGRLNNEKLSSRTIEGLINSFVQTSHKTLQGEHPNVMKALLGFAAAIIVTLLAGIVGFSIGFAAGIWSGPGAFFTGLAAGEAAALATAGACVSSGLVAGGLTAWGMFRPSKEVTAVDEFAKTIQEHYSPGKK